MKWTDGTYSYNTTIMRNVFMYAEYKMQFSIEHRLRTKQYANTNYSLPHYNRIRFYCQIMKFIQLQIHRHGLCRLCYCIKYASSNHSTYTAPLLNARKSISA